MPVGTSEWRAGIARYEVLIVLTVCYAIPVFEIFKCILSYFAYLYFFILMSVVTFPYSLLVSSTWSHIPISMSCLTPYRTTESSDIMYKFVEVKSQATCFVISLVCKLLKCSNHIILRKNFCTKKFLMVLQFVLFVLQIGKILEMHQLGQRYPIHMLLLLSRGVHQNPGPLSNKCLKSFHWNLNRLCARDRIKIPLIETYDTLHKFDITAV